MKNSIEKFSVAIEKSFSIAKPFLLQTAMEKAIADQNSILLDLKSESGVKVPIVGDFDAGKSSLINALVGRKDLLPTAITPETAVAYELYYSLDEKLIHTRDGNELRVCGLSDIKGLDVKPGDVVKVYLNSNVVKDLNDRGIVLVDMPGLGSGIEAHNNAILHYIGKGSSFVFVVDCEAGTVSSSTLSFMHELSQYNLKSAVIISKIDKKPADEIPAMKEVIAYHVKKAVNHDVFVGSVSSADGNVSDFSSFLGQLDSESLVYEKYKNRVCSFIDSRIFDIKSQIDVINANIQDVEAAVKELEDKKNKLQEDLGGNVLNADTPEKSTNDILLILKEELEANVDKLASAIADKQDANSIKSIMLSIIRPALSRAFKIEAEQYASALNAVVDDMSQDLQNALQIDDDFIGGMVNDFRTEIIGFVEVAAEFLLNSPNIFAKILGGILAFLGDLIPDVLNWIFGKSKDEIIYDIISKLNQEIIPAVCEKLRPVLYEQVVAQQDRIRKAITETATGKISVVQDSVRRASTNASKEELEAKKSTLNNVIKELSEIKSEL